MTAALLAAALLLDALLGEPEALWRRLPHPAVLMGRLIGACDRRFNRGGARRLKGALVLAALLAGALALGGLLEHLPLAPLWQVILAAVLLAQRSLSQHVRAVAQALALSLPEGRRAVARIVGRDTAVLDQPGVVRAAVESGAENLSDGVIAPAFWFLLGGLPGILAYKLANTADSMIGHRTPRHQAFGWAAARLDDLLNLIPARLTAVLLWLAGGDARRGDWRGQWRAIAADARLHRSPNAGWPEAAMARALGIALSGPRSYHGVSTPLPWVNGAGDRKPGAEAIMRADQLLWRAWGLMLALVLLVGAVVRLCA